MEQRRYLKGPGELRGDLTWVLDALPVLQRYWSGLPFPSLEDLPDPGIEPRSTCTAGRCFIL